jgi:hypothetical protein
MPQAVVLLVCHSYCRSGFRPKTATQFPKEAAKTPKAPAASARVAKMRELAGADDAEDIGVASECSGAFCCDMWRRWTLLP